VGQLFLNFREGPRRVQGGPGVCCGNGQVVGPPFDWSPTPNLRKEEEGYGTVRALDTQTGERKWEFKMADVTEAGILTTASDLLFSGGREGYFFALDARNGELLWKVALGAAVQSGPLTYSVKGRQYVAVNAGNCLFTFALRQ